MHRFPNNHGLDIREDAKKPERDSKYNSFQPKDSFLGQLSWVSIDWFFGVPSQRPILVLPGLYLHLYAPMSQGQAYLYKVAQLIALAISGDVCR